MKYYLAGPMKGIPQLNFPAFIDASRNLREKGFDIISPHELDDDETVKKALADMGGKEYTDGQTWGTFLARDVKIVADLVQGIIFLPNWERSKGARLEAFVALLSGHKFYEYHSERGLGTQLDPSLVAGICVAQWMPREVRVMANVPEARKIAT